MLPIDFTSFAEKWTFQIAMSRWFRVKEVMRHEIASVTRLRITNEDGGREDPVKWNSEMKLFRVENWTSPRPSVSEYD
jgi:hypothetical protein